jgi:uncharacterized lipoprotein YmbA
MMNAKRLSLPAGLLCAGLLLAGCAGSPAAQDHDYLLRPQKLMVASGNRSVVQLKPVAVAPYLDQKGMVLQTGSSEIRVARHHRWAEPLDEAVERYLQVSIANQADVAVESTPLTTVEEDATVTVRINQLHGTESGQVRLVADWKVDRAGEEPMLHSYDESITQSADGYPALVAAHAELLDGLSGAIADSLKAGQQ